MAPKSRVKRKTAASSQLSTDVRKKQHMSSKATEATPKGVETLPSSTPSGLEETPAIDVASETVPSSSVVGARIAGPSTTGVDLGTGVAEMGIAMAGSSACVPATSEATTDVSNVEGATAN